MEIVSRKSAISLGLKRYFTGKPCAHGHVSERWVASYACISCKQTPEAAENMRLYNKAYGEKNSEKLRSEAMDRYWLNRDSILEKNSARRAENLSAYRKREREYARANSGERSAYHVQWRQCNMDKCRANGSNYRARKKNAEGRCSAAEFKKIIIQQKYKCANCKCDLLVSGHHADHIMPLFLGGTNWPDNIQALCPTCNVRKNARDPIEWAQENGRLI